MSTLKQLREAIEHQKGSDSTQVATTSGTYEKAANKHLVSHAKDGDKYLDYGAGLGQGTEAMKKAFHDGGKKVSVESYEPSTRSKTFKPTHKSSDSIHPNSYAGVQSHNVLNVLHPKLRTQVTHHMLSLPKVGGHVVVSTRKWKGDVNSAKNASPAPDEHKALLVHKKGGDVYQRGFDGDELLHHMKSHDTSSSYHFERHGDTVVGKRIK